MRRIRLATAWLSGCSGCHMSLLNLHGHLLELFEQCELVYSPLADIKAYPLGVDVCLVEGAVGRTDDLEQAALIRERTTIVVSLGDCAVNGNITALRNPLGSTKALVCGYGEGSPLLEVPQLLARVLPLHRVIRVDAYIPGCPPEPARIAAALDQLLANPEQQ